MKRKNELAIATKGAIKMSKVTYKLEKVDGRFYFNDGTKYALIDTGYGRSVSIDGEIGPFKVSHCDKDNLHAFNPTFMRDGQRIGAILCPLDGFSCLMKGDSVTIDDDARELPGHEWFLPFAVPGLPLLECKVDGKTKRLFFDSGMRLPVLDDDSLVVGKEKLGTILEWIGPLGGLAEAPYYKATFDFPCGFRFDGHLEHDCLHMFIEMIRKSIPLDGFLGIEFFKRHDLFISAIKGKSGLAIIRRQ